ncbi:MAG: hypothetical protein AABO57_09560 [Acidobacteriota bacterium]
MSSCTSNTKNDSSFCKQPTIGPHLGTLEAVVQSYRETCQSRLEAQLRTFGDEPTLQSAVARAALAETPDGKRYSHQRRIKRVVLREMRRRLLEIGFSKLRSFDEIHNAVDQAIGSIRGVGDLLLYDTALRIGAKLGIMPDRVYLHSGTRRGARALGLPSKRRSISIAELPVALRGLKPHEIEDCLCIFKDDFQGAAP